MIKDPTDPSETSRKAMEYMKLKREGRQMQSADDPTSGDADSFRQQLYAIAPSMKGKFDGMTLAQMERGSPMLMAQFKAQGDERMARIAAGARAGEKADARAEKAEAAQLTRDEKKKASLVEIEDRRRNIEDNVTLLEKMIEDNGTYELTGSHNADLDRRVDMIATDMAKLADPNSVARPAEVELFKKGLVHSTMNPANLSNGTALNLLKNFRGELDSRVANAYKIREAQDPGSQTLRDNGGKRTVVKQERNKKTGEMRVTYSDGSKEVISSTAASK
jgi:cell pole-organizing protein PopZ